VPPGLSVKYRIYEHARFGDELLAAIRGHTSISNAERGYDDILLVFPTIRTLQFFYTVLKHRVLRTTTTSDDSSSTLKKKTP